MTDLQRASTSATEHRAPPPYSHAKQIFGVSKREYRIGVTVALSSPHGQPLNQLQLATIFTIAVAAAQRTVQHAVRRLAWQVRRAVRLGDQTLATAQRHQRFDIDERLVIDRSILSIKEGRSRSGALAAHIAADQGAGRGRVHERASWWWNALAYTLAVPEVIALVVVLASALNAWGNPFVMFVATALPVAALLTQLVLVSKAAEYSNAAREAEHELDLMQADIYRRRMRLLSAATAAVTVVLAALVVMRIVDLLSIGEMGTDHVLALAGLGVVAAVATPALKWVAVASDGTSTSRTRDAIDVAVHLAERDRTGLRDATEALADKTERATHRIITGPRRRLLERVATKLNAGDRTLLLACHVRGINAPSFDSGVGGVAVPIRPGGPDPTPLQHIDARIAAVNDKITRSRDLVASTLPEY